MKRDLRSSRSTTNLRCLKSQKSTDLIYTAAEALNHEHEKFALKVARKCDVTILVRSFSQNELNESIVGRAEFCLYRSDVGVIFTLHRA